MCYYEEKGGKDWELEACRSASLSCSAVNNRNLSNKVRRKINTLGLMSSSSFLVLIIMCFIFWRGPYILPESGWVLLWYLCHNCAGEYVLSRWSIRTLKKIWTEPGWDMGHHEKTITKWRQNKNNTVVDSQSSAGCLAVDLCTWFHHLLNKFLWQ